MSERDAAATPEVDAYCRAIETHLCRKNDGYLIRVSGPAFEMVRGWAEQGIPLGVATAGIDCTFDRYYAKGPRRRPVQISFCEADVLDAFDAWRRALGLTAAAPAAAGAADAPAGERSTRAESLPAHLERVMSRLTRLRAAASSDRELDDALEAAVREIDAARAGARQARGDVRAAILAMLDRVDEQMLGLARARLAPDRRAALEREAEMDLAAFRERMTPGRFASARHAALDRLVRAAAGLPVIRYEG